MIIISEHLESPDTDLVCVTVLIISRYVPLFYELLSLVCRAFAL